MRELEYYEGSELPLSRPVSPKKPGVGATSQDFKKYAKELEAFEAEEKKFREELLIWRRQKNELRKELVKDLAELHRISVEAAQMIFNRTWDNYHDEGLERVIVEFEDMIAFLESLPSIWD